MAKLFVLNLGSTSSKVAVFEDETMVQSTTLRHSTEELKPFRDVLSQQEFRKTCVEEWMKKIGWEFEELDLLVVRGALMKPIEGGIYEVTDAVVWDAKDESFGSHISTVGLLIGHSIAVEHGLPVIFLDAPVTDELCDAARYSGLKGYDRRSVFHALNSKQIARQAAAFLGKPIDEVRFIVAHLGGGISVSAHDCGRVIDVNNALDGEGPFSPERVGAIPAMEVLKLMEAYDDNRAMVKKLLVGLGGLNSYLGHGNVAQAMEDAKTNPEVRAVMEAMAYQIAKEIGAMACVLKGKVDAVCFTGGIAYNQEFLGYIRKYTDWIAPVHIFPGEDELKAMALGGLRYLRGEETPKVYR